MFAFSILVFALLGLAIYSVVTHILRSIGCRHVRVIRTPGGCAQCRHCQQHLGKVSAWEQKTGRHTEPWGFGR